MLALIELDLIILGTIHSTMNFDEMSMSGLCMTYMYIKNKHDHRISVLTTWIVIFTQIDCAIYGASVAVHFSFKTFFSHGAPWKNKQRNAKLKVKRQNTCFCPLPQWVELIWICWADALELLLKRSLFNVCSWLQISDQLPWENTRVGQVKVQAAISTCFRLDWLFKMFLPF